jgi:pilus assembly protein CpaC
MTGFARNKSSGWFGQIALAGLLVLSVPAARGASPDAVVAAIPAPPAVQTVITDGLDSDGSVRLSVNRTRLIVLASKLRNADKDGAAITEGSADIATVQPMSANSVLVTAKKLGSTNLILEDDLGHRQQAEIIVEADLDGIRQQLKGLSPQANIEADDVNGTIVLRGHIPSLKLADEAVQIATAYAGKPDKVANLLEISGGQQVMLQVKVAEVSKSALSQLGINIGYTDGRTFVGSNINTINPFATSGGNLFTQTLTSIAPGANVQFFGNILAQRSAFDYFVNCLQQNQLMRTLSEPDLTALSGEQANFQVGGQIPIPVPQQGGSGTTGSVITVQYQNYGVLLHFTPVVLGDGRIRLKIDPEISDLDYAHGVSIGGFVIPGFITRTVDTTVELADGQTFTLAGLLSNQVTATSNATPVLGDLPIIGSLFRSVSYQRNQTELVVMVTPRLVEPLNPDQVLAGPGEHWRYPSQADLFLWRDLGGEAGEKAATALNPPAPGASVKTAGPPPQYHGEYGFTPTADTKVLEQ